MKASDDKNSKNLLGSEKAYRFFMSAPVIIGYLRGENYIIELANDSLLKVWQKSRDIIGQPLLEVFPEMENQGIRQLLDDVRTTGKPFYAYSFPITFQRAGESVETLYFDFVYQPFYEAENSAASGVISVGYNVTIQVQAKQKVEESERKWKELADSMPVLVWAADAKGEITFLNKSWYDYAGLNTEQSADFGWLKIVHPDDVAMCREVWSKAVNEQRSYELEVRYRSKQGEYRWMIAQGVPVKKDDILVGWYGTSTDIQEQKQLELNLEDKIRERTSELHAKNHLLDNILIHSSNGIAVSQMLFDEAGEVIDAQTILANDAAIRFSGLPRELYLTKPASYFDPHIISSPYGQACINTLRTGEPFLLQYFVAYSSRWLELTVSKMDDRHLIHIFTDVTSVKETQLRLEQSLEDLKYSNANLEEFAYAASHDLKEPVRKIQFFTNMLTEELKDTLTEEQKSLFNRLENSSKRMEKLINDLLEYSQAAKGSAEKEDIDLNSKLRLVLDDLELEVQKRQARVTLHDLPTIRGNRRQLQQLFQNLISNALKYSKPDVPPEISISCRTVKAGEANKNLPHEVLEKKYYHITVADNGIGFEQKDADRIFKVFMRLHSTRDYRGSGIGLSIVQKVVEGHQGFVWATSQPNAGSQFNILLPIENPA